MDLWDLLLTDARIATMRAGGGGAYGAIEDGALAIRDGAIAWVASVSGSGALLAPATLH